MSFLYLQLNHKVKQYKSYRVSNLKHESVRTDSNNSQHFSGSDKSKKNGIRDQYEAMSLVIVPFFGTTSRK